LSIYPSVWRDNGCKSHYIIWRDKIYLFDHQLSAFDDGFEIAETSALADRVLKVLPRDRFMPFAEVAKALDAVPWDALFACRHLVAAGLAKEGHGKQSAHFARLDRPWKRDLKRNPFRKRG
jgi:hypothetical protein